MKRLLLTILLASVIFSSSAEATETVYSSTTKKGTTKASVNDALTFCDVRGQLGANIMQWRQSGVPMSEVVVQFENLPSAKYWLSLIADAYTVNRWNGDALQKGAIADFVDSVYTRCYNTKVAPLL